MKQLLVLVGCVVLLFSGCQESGRSKSAVELNIEGGGKFPKFLAGTWGVNINDLNYWKIVFEPSGVISSAVVPLGEVEVRPNQRTKVPGSKGEPGFFEGGNFDVYYNTQSRELVVNIKIKQFYLYMIDGGILKGSWEYLIAGDVSEDGKTWESDVLNSIDIVVLAPPDPNSIDKPKFEEAATMRINLGEEEGEHLIFTKAADVNVGSSR